MKVSSQHDSFLVAKVSAIEGSREGFWVGADLRTNNVHGSAGITLGGRSKVIEITEEQGF
jgi:hypothetical protein